MYIEGTRFGIYEARLFVSLQSRFLLLHIVSAMTSREKHNAYRRAWWAKSLGDQLTESRIFLPREAHEWVARLAAEVEERIPLVLGKLVVAQIRNADETATNTSSLNAQQRDKDEKNAENVATSPTSHLHNLFQAVLSSRFPDETGSARLRQVGFLAAIATEIEAGQKPTASSIANRTDNHVSQITMLAKTMNERGVIDIRHAPSVRKGKAAKIFSIRSDAIKALHAAHLEATGKAIDDITPT
ncbi:hypothetical protein [Rhizobium sp. NPDC090279]|uniref:hypothetical protein n=1 Tax=Rhizobium sp. NPDC090279 TaxID=3364499 RepID=UPI00383A3EC4